jgi:thioredoxin-related protein
MKTLYFIAIAVSVFFTACSNNDKSKTIDAVSNTGINKVEVIDFYGTHRCVTCEAIEANAKYTVEHFFADEVKSGQVAFKTIFVDDEANYDMAERFEAVGTALFLNVIKDGKETHIDLTDFGFSKGRDKEVFTEELKTKIETELKKL